MRWTLSAGGDPVAVRLAQGSEAVAPLRCDRRGWRGLNGRLGDALGLRGRGRLTRAVYGLTRLPLLACSICWRAMARASSSAVSPLGEPSSAIRVG
jgi:hypothetical protein